MPSTLADGTLGFVVFFGFISSSRKIVPQNEAFKLLFFCFFLDEKSKQQVQHFLASDKFFKLIYRVTMRDFRAYPKDKR